MLAAETARRRKQEVLPILRTDAGGFFGFGGHDGRVVDNFQGKFAQLLPPKPPRAEERELARAMLAVMGITQQRLRADAGQCER